MVSSSGSFSGRLLPPPDPARTTSELFRLEDMDVHRVAQAMAQIIGHSSAPQTQANPIAVGTASKGTCQAHEG